MLLQKSKRTISTNDVSWTWLYATSKDLLQLAHPRLWQLLSIVVKNSSNREILLYTSILQIMSGSKCLKWNGGRPFETKTLPGPLFQIYKIFINDFLYRTIFVHEPLRFKSFMAALFALIPLHGDRVFHYNGVIIGTEILNYESFTKEQT